jgi:hypothetical protein
MRKRPEMVAVVQSSSDLLPKEAATGQAGYGTARRADSGTKQKRETANWPARAGRKGRAEVEDRTRLLRQSQVVQCKDQGCQVFVLSLQEILCPKNRKKHLTMATADNATKSFAKK